MQQKLAGMGLVACSSGKHEGKTKISHRGRKRLRYWGSSFRCGAEYHESLEK